MADWLRDHYEIDEDGNFKTQEEFERAKKNGDVAKDAWGNDYNPNNLKETYYDDGTVR